MSDKQLALEVITGLPESTTLDEIGREIKTLVDLRGDSAGEEDLEMTAEILAAIEEGEADIAAGRFHTHAEVKEMIRQWRSK